MNLSSLFRKKDLSTIKPPEGLNRILSVKDLVFFGIAAIVGAGIFSTIGEAAAKGGPAISLLFVLVAITCIFTALCYAQFASMVPINGSAYTYAYISIGEVFAWIIGWALILEYAVSNIAIAISWSEYFTTMLDGFGVNFFPEWMAIGFSPAYNAYQDFMAAQTSGVELAKRTISDANIYMNAPEILGFKMIFNLPAGIVTIFITILVYVGIRQSKNASNLFVWIKLAIIFGVIILGSFYIKPENWVPFAPNGASGVLGGIAAVFFSFIGFDSISTTAEECKNPQKDIPRAMIICIICCTVLYISVALVLTGMANSNDLKVADPLAHVFNLLDMNFIAGVIAICAVIAMTGAILVYQIAQPRIWMTMSRDGLLSKKFAKIHPKYKTPSYATIITGLVVGFPAMFFDMSFMVDLTSVGTFFAFIMVCTGILYLDYKGESKAAKFKIPYVNSKYLILPVLVLVLYILINEDMLIPSIQEKPLLVILFIIWIGLGITSFKYNYSLIPILGILINVYLMVELGESNWIMFVIWLTIGLVIYFLYGYKKSKLANN